MNRLCSLLLLAVLAVPAQALASDAAVDVGVELYRHGDYKGAVLALNKALQHGVSDPSDRATARIYLASSYEARGQNEQARSALTELFRESPAVPIDSALFPPSFVKLSDSVRKEVASSGTPAPATATAPATVQPASETVTPPMPAAAPVAAPASTNLVEQTDSGWELGFRVAYSAAGGSLEDGTSLSDIASGTVPLQLDVGYRITPHWVAGVYLSGGLVFLKLDCPAGTDCSASQARFGVEGAYHILPGTGFDPWLGLGIGVESLKVTASNGGFSVSGSTSYFEFLNLQAGADFPLSHKMALGPFLQFQAATGSSNGSSGTQTWFGVGGKLTYDFY